MKTVGFSILGQEQDNKGGGKEKRWSTFRPTVAFALQKMINFDELVIAYQTGQEDLLKLVCSDIEERSHGNIKLRKEKMPFTKTTVYDFNTCFQIFENLSYIIINYLI